MRTAVWSRLRLLTIGGGAAGYHPWPSFSSAHNSPATFVLCSGAERVGKSVATAMEAMAWVPVSTLIWIAGPQYRDTMKEFSYMAEACLNAGITTKKRVSINEKGPSSIDIIDPKTMETVCRVETRSLWDIERALVSEAPDLILVVEAGLNARDPLEKLRLRVSTRRGRVWLSGTLEDASPWFQAAYERWQAWPNEESGSSIAVPLYENKQDFPGGVDNLEIASLRKALRPSTFAHRVLGKPAPSELLVFNKTFRRGMLPFCADSRRRLMPLAANGERLPVEISIDPGWHPSHYAVHFIQIQEDDICVIDEVVARKTPHESVIAEVKRRPAWDNVVGGVMDPWAARQHGMGNAKSALDIWYEETGLKLRMAEPAPTPNQIIDRYWYYLERPHTGGCNFFFNPETCPHFAHEWKSWRYFPDADGRPLRTEPVKRDCDGLKGVGCWLVDYFTRHQWMRGVQRRTATVTGYRFQ